MEPHKQPVARIDPAHPDVILIQFIPGNSWDEIHAAFEQQRELARQHDGPVGVIMDVSASPEPPDNTTLTKANAIFRNQPSNVKVVVMAGGSRFSQVLATIVRNAGIVNMHSASTLDDAFSLAEQKLKA
jgi:hypothetical protein